MKRIVRCLLLSLFSAVIIIGSLSVTAAVYAGDKVPDVSGSAKCSLTITMAAHDDSTETTVSGEILTIYKIASLTTKGGSAEYTLTSDFSGTGIKLEGMTVEQSIAYAKTLQDYASSHHLSGEATAATNENGIVTFENLGVGMYLVTESGRTGDAKKYNSLQPFLIMVPQYNNGSWIYDVKALPKIEQKKTGTKDYTTSSTTTTSTTSTTSYTTSSSTTSSHTPTVKGYTTVVKTGDASNLPLWTAVMAIAILCVMVLMIRSPYHRNRR